MIKWVIMYQGILMVRNLSRLIGQLAYHVIQWAAKLSAQGRKGVQKWRID